MPQLMPLKWIFSNMMIIMLIVSGCMIYSEMNEGVEVELLLSKWGKSSKLWFW